MDWYATIKKYYNKNLYTKEDVKKFVEAGKITPEQYESITGIPYKEQ